MKWFFLVLLVLIAFGVEVLFIKGTAPLSAHGVSAAVAFALFCFALFAYWLASYFLKGATRDRCSEFAHSILMLSIGVYFILVGGQIVISGACAFPLPLTGTSVGWERRLAEVTKDLQDSGWCAALGYSFLILGVAFSWPTLKLFGVFVRKARQPSL